MIDPRTGEYAVIAPGHNFRSVTQKIAGIVLTTNTPWGWFGGLAVAGGIATLVLIALTWLFLKGVGIWGVTIPGAWGFAIINFVWWIGIGHAGTLISAILLLFKQTWRNSINRFAEAMTIFAVCCAGIFPLIHVGRPWVSYWLFPYPNTMNVWPQFRSPLAWDVFAVSTYATISVVFWYIGMIPDFGTMRDRAVLPLAKYFYGMLSLGWRGSTRHWIRYETASLLLAGLATPLVLSVHTVISFDFAVAAMAGWHTTIFPPYFVAGAIFSGFGMVLTLMLPLRAVYKLEDLITQYHIDCMCKITLATGSMVGYAYAMEFFIAWYGANPYEGFTFINRAFGPYAWAYWIMVSCNVITPQLFWFKAVRRNTTLVWVLSLFVNLGMWFERFVIICTSLTRDFLPSSWGYLSPTVVDIFTFFGTFGVFSVLFLLFIRFLPMMAAAELKAVTPQADPHAGHEHS
jgi:molybdopterin-containing oxidoreductase family membrane subunit